jgi:uncharacterized protein YyaL (SSP411 family)
VTEHGNFEHKNILHVQTDISTSAKRFNIGPDELKTTLAESRRILLEARNKRVYPGLDDKIITSWNGLMLSAFARAYQATKEKSYKEVIRKNIDFLKNNLYKEDRLLRTYNRGKAKYNAFIDDYAFLIQGLLDAYEALFDTEYIEWALKLLNYSNEKFWDKDNYGYFYTSSDHPNLIERMKDEHDQSIPSAASILLINNLRFYSITENDEFLSLAEYILKKYGKRIESNPYGYASYLLGLDFYLQKPKEIVLVVPQKVKPDKFYDTVFQNYNPNKVVMLLDDNQPSSTLSASLLAGKKPLKGKLTAYVCHNFACSQPVFTTGDLKKLLE